MTLISSWHVFGHPKLKAVQQQCLWPKKHSIQKIIPGTKYVRIALVCRTRYTSYVQVMRIVLEYSAVAYIIVHICGTVKCGNKMMAYCPRHYLRGQLVASHPLFLDFHILGTVGQRWSLYRVYTHFIWHHDERATRWYHNVWSCSFFTAIVNYKQQCEEVSWETYVYTWNGHHT